MEGITCRPIHWSQDRSSSFFATMLKDSRSLPPADAMSGGLDWDPLEPTPRTYLWPRRPSLTYFHGFVVFVTHSVTQPFAHFELSACILHTRVSISMSYTRPCTAACGIISLQAIRIFECTRGLLLYTEDTYCLNV